jgi:hypothetical protein
MEGQRAIRRTWGRRVAALALLMLVTAACRAVAVTTDSAGTFAIDVHNSLGQPVSVAFDDGSAVRALGTLAAGRQERFLVVRPARLQVAIIATGEHTGQTLRRDVTLRPDGVVSVRF